MPEAEVNGVGLYYETAGEGFPLVLSHEFAGDYRSWAPQVEFFSRHYRVITYNHRGFPPSSVPEDATAYSQDILVEDLHQLLRHLDIPEAYIGGCSMGGSVALQFAFVHPEMVRALALVATGAGATDRETFEPKLEGLARQVETEGWKTVAWRYALDPNRVQLRRKDPEGWREFTEALAAHHDTASAHLIRELILKRPPISTLGAQMERLKVPALIMVGDEDDMCLPPALMMKKHLSGAGLLVFPRSGHAVNLEEPDNFNRLLAEFLTAVETGNWQVN